MDVKTKKKITLYLTGLISTMFLFIAVFSPVDYVKQLDARKRQYYPATVIDKYYTSSCSKSSCNKYHYVRVELEDGSYKDIHTTEDVFDSAVVGNSISFERHITDPKVIWQEAVGYIWFILTLLIWPVGLMYRDYIGHMTYLAKHKITIKEK